METVYLISVLILFTVFILVKKSEKKINILSFICISIITLFCYNTFICYILTFFTIPITLWILAVINAIISICFIVNILKTKKIQKYIFTKCDAIYITIFATVVLIISYFNFGFPFDVNYETGDPSVHYLTSVMFAESDALLAGAEEDDVYGSFNVRKTVSYVNSGLLMKCFCENLDPIECYNIFVIFGIVTLYLTGVTFFTSLTNFAKNKEQRFWAFILALICMIGYPLNSFLFGFEYLSMGLLVICGIIELMYYYDREILNMKWFIISLALLNFGLFASYYMFVPFMYPALWIYFYLKNYQNTKRIINKHIIVLWIVTLIVPFVLGYIYHLAPNIYAIFINKFTDIGNVANYSAHIINSGFAVNGYIYTNIYSNMLLLLPLTGYLFIKKTKKRELKSESFIALLLTLLIIFIEILLIGNSFGKVSMYYLSKNYFALWIVLLYCNYKALVLISEKNKFLPRLYISAYIILMIIYTIFSNVKVEYYIRNPYENILSVMDIFAANKTIVQKERDFNQDELEILKYARDNLDYKSEIEIVADEQPNYWAYVLLRYINDEEVTKEIYGQDKLNVKRYLLESKIGNVDYVIYFNRAKQFDKVKDKLFMDSIVIYENESGGILKYKK